MVAARREFFRPKGVEAAIQFIQFFPGLAIHAAGRRMGNAQIRIGPDPRRGGILLPI